MILLKRPKTFYLGSVRYSRPRTRLLGWSNWENRWYKGKDVIVITLWHSEDQCQVFLRLQSKKKEDKNSEKNNSIDFLSVVEKNLLIRTRPTRRIKTTKEISGVTEDEKRVVTMTHLSQILILFLKKKKTSSKSNSSTVGGKNITSLNVLRNKIQKTNIVFVNLHAGDCS